MSDQDALFDQPPSEKLEAVRKHLIAESEKADEALERAGQKSADARLRVYQINEAIEAAVKNEKAAAGILTYEVASGTGEIV